MSTAKIIKQGYLVKKGAKRKNWKTRWFILRGFQLEYYADPMDAKPKGCIDLNSSCSVATVTLSRPNGFQLVTPERTFYLAAGNSTLRDQWIQAISAFVK